MGIRFTTEEDEFIRNNLETSNTLHDLVERFNSRFPCHQIKYSNLVKRMQKLGIKKGTHNIRKERIWHKNAYGTIIKSKGKSARVKTEQGYVSANRHYREQLGVSENEVIINLNGDKCDFSKGNIVVVSRTVYTSMCWRGWFFTDSELTKTAILTAKLLQYFPELIHNENQYYGIRNRGN